MQGHSGSSKSAADTGTATVRASASAVRPARIRPACIVLSPALVVLILSADPAAAQRCAGPCSTKVVETASAKGLDGGSDSPRLVPVSRNPRNARKIEETRHAHS